MTEDKTNFGAAELSTELLDAVQPFSGPSGDAFPGAEGLGSGVPSVRKTGTKYVTSMVCQNPRVMTRFSTNVCVESESAGQAFYWGWNVNTNKGKRWIQGGTIDLAMCLLRHYGNCAMDMEVEETRTHYFFTATFIDLESGLSFPRLFRQRKSQNIGDKMDGERAEDMVFQIGQSKAIRNAVLGAMPGWLIDKAIGIAKNAEKNGIGQNIAEARTEALKFFTDRGAKQEDIEATIGKAADDWSVDDIVDLRGMATAVHEKRVTIKEMFAPAEEEVSDPAAESGPAQEEKPPVQEEKPGAGSGADPGGGVGADPGGKTEEDNADPGADPGETTEAGGAEQDAQAEAFVVEFWHMRKEPKLRSYYLENRQRLLNFPLEIVRHKFALKWERIVKEALDWNYGGPKPDAQDVADPAGKVDEKGPGADPGPSDEEADQQLGILGNGNREDEPDSIACPPDGKWPGETVFVTACQKVCKVEQTCGPYQEYLHVKKDPK